VDDGPISAVTTLPTACVCHCQGTDVALIALKCLITKKSNPNGMVIIGLRNASPAVILANMVQKHENITSQE
jgi:hypothetical protein